MRARSVGLGLGCAAAVAVAAQIASAASLGGKLNGNPAPSSCSGTGNPSCTIFNDSLPGRRVVAQKSGTITSWSVRGASGRMRLVIVAGGPAARHVVATSAYKNVTKLGTVTFKSSVPIKAGQRIGLELANGARGGIGYVGPGATEERFLPPLGATPRRPDYIGPQQYELFLAVTEKVKKH